jgi:hypothetical protein
MPEDDPTAAEATDPEDASQAEHKAFIEAHHARIAAVARTGYREQGRGAVFMFEDAILEVASGAAPGLTVEYVADGSEALVRRGGWPTEGHAALVRDYDPQRTMIVLVGRRIGGRDIFTYKMLCDEPPPDDGDGVSLADLIA